MKAVELREMMLEELRGRELELIEELIQYKLQLSIKRMDNPLKVRETKRELARVKTIINEKIREGKSNPDA
ncbi:MAG: 50S ribosomal protein L29 [Candidatus Krumholzibacteriota bacterium]|nr:50S ribosomal protein L29 [Candidatus Krumholzibacteriota bacterium]